MDWQERKRSLIQLMGRTLEQVFHVLNTELDPASPLHNEFILQKSQFEETRREERNGTISRSDKNLVYNRIRVSLRDIVGMMTEKDFHPDIIWEMDPEWLHLAEEKPQIARKTWVWALMGAAVMVLILIAFPFYRRNHQEAKISIAARDSVEFYGMITDRQDRTLGNVTIRIGMEEIAVGPNGRFRQKLPFPADTILPLKILLGDSLLYSNDELIHSPYDKKLTNYP